MSGMADVSKKEITLREALAEGKIILQASVILALRAGKIPKGDVLAAARLAGILGAKNTPSLIPLCHPLPIEYAEVKFIISETDITIQARVKARARTGVEMEALTAVSLAALTIYDMCKPLDKEIVITGIKLLKKTGGKSGTYERK